MSTRDASIIRGPGTADSADTALIETTERALTAGIAAATPGNRLGDISHAVGAVGRAAGYGILADHGGHDEYRVDPDGWTLRSANGTRAAHAEHTIALTPDGPRVLTAQ